MRIKLPIVSIKAFQKWISAGKILSNQLVTRIQEQKPPTKDLETKFCKWLNSGLEELKKMADKFHFNSLSSQEEFFKAIEEFAITLKNHEKNRKADIEHLEKSFLQPSVIPKSELNGNFPVNFSSKLIPSSLLFQQAMALNLKEMLLGFKKQLDHIEKQ